MLAALALALHVALAAPADDLALAANKDRSESDRMAAFQRLVSLGATDLGWVKQVSADDAADARQRWVAVRVLGQVRGPQARESLIALLEDEMPAMRAAACSALGDTGDRTVVAAVAMRLGDPAILVRGAASDALAGLGDPAAVPALSDALSARDNYFRGSSLWVRPHFAEALGRIGHKSAVPALVRGLDDADPEVVRASVAAFESVARFSYGDGRSLDQQREAWRRWAAVEIGNPGAER